MVWHYHADDLPGEAAAVELTFASLPQESGTARLEHFRIDDEHSNAYTAWQQMGSPPELTERQLAELEKTGQLAQLEVPGSVDIVKNQATIRFQLPRQGVSLVLLHLDSKR